MKDLKLRLRLPKDAGFTEITRYSRQSVFRQAIQRFHKLCCIIILLSSGGVSLLISQPVDSWREESDYRWIPLVIADSSNVGLSAVDPRTTGVVFKNILSERAGAENRVLFNGSGVAVGDFDRDGLPDIFFCGLESENKLYRNLGQWKFRDVTEESGLRFENGFYHGAVFADINGDRHLDLLVGTHQNGALYFENNQAGGFLDKTQAAGLASQDAATTMALADVDGNGTLDLYIANNRPSQIRDEGRIQLQMLDGKLLVPPKYQDRLTIIDGKVEEFGQPDSLYLNRGGGVFERQSWTEGFFRTRDGSALSEPPKDWGLSAAFQDLNGDGLPDLYVCNDFWTPDRIWFNSREQGFQEKGLPDFTKTSASSMGVDFSDIDADGDMDAFVLDMLSRDVRLRKRQQPAQAIMDGGQNPVQRMRNTLFLNREGKAFAEIAWLAGLEAADWAWCPLFIDLDLDGWEDLLITAGHFKDVQDMDANRLIQSRQKPRDPSMSLSEVRRQFKEELFEHNRLYPPLDMPLIAFRNSGNLTFEEKTDSWGVTAPKVRHGMAAGDFDQDGDLDLAINVLNQHAEVLENHSAQPRIAIRLIGAKPNTQAIGARVKASVAGFPDQFREVQAGGHYLSGRDAQITFAAKIDKPMVLEIRWRNGAVTRLNRLTANRFYEINELDKPARPQRPEIARKRQTPNFEEATPPLPRSHQEKPFDDYARQPLLPFKLSQPGPGIAWLDLDNDGFEDLIIGAARGSRPLFLHNKSGNRFEEWPEANAPKALSDMSSIVGFAASAETRTVLMGLTDYESTPSSSLIQLPVTAGHALEFSPVETGLTGVGAMAAADMDGDLDLDLFVAGHVIPGRYPEGYPGRILKQENGEWRLDESNSVPLDRLGIVNSALWCDLNDDGFPELVTASEWESIKVFENRRGRLFDQTRAWGLESDTGWWHGLAAGDFNNDGKMDLAAANWGLNSPFQPGASAPLQFFYGELSRPGIVDVLETTPDPRTGKPAPARFLQDLAGSLPFLYQGVRSYRQYSEASLDELLGARMALAKSVSAQTMESCVFLNEGNRFRKIPLPVEAQLSPAYGVVVADFNGDGNEDLFLGQNFFPLREPLGRLDAGRGLLLKGNGDGTFEAASIQASGVDIQGEQRGAAAADFNRDGRTDLAVAVNNAPARLFLNQTAPPGIRVELAGPPKNALAFGSRIRLGDGANWGPARLIQNGGSYWSQNGTVQVLYFQGEATQVLVVWPDGRRKQAAIDPEKRTVRIEYP